MPTYKATPQLEASTEVTNPFRFEFTVDEGRPVRPSVANPAAPSIPPMPPGCSPLSQPAPPDKRLGASLRQGEGGLPRERLASVNKKPDHTDLAEIAGEENARLQDGYVGRRESTANVVKPSRSADSRSFEETRKGRRSVRVEGNRQGTGIELVDLDKLPEVELPDADRGARRQRLEGPTAPSTGRTEGGREPALGKGQAGQDGELGAPEARREGQAAEGLGRVDEGRERVRQRLMEVVRAKARADERQSPLKRRSPDSPTTGVSRMAKLLKPGVGDRNAAPGTPLSLADDCPLLEIPDIAEGSGAEVRNRGLGPQSAGGAPALGQSLVIEVPGSLDAPATPNADVPVGLIVDPLGGSSEPKVPVEPPQAPPTAVEDSGRRGNQIGGPLTLTTGPNQSLLQTSRSWPLFLFQTKCTEGPFG